MTILDAIREAVEAENLREPFSAGDAAAALQGYGFSLGSVQVTLRRYSRPGGNRAAPPIRRVGKGKYRLAQTNRGGPDRRARDEAARGAP